MNRFLLCCLVLLTCAWAWPSGWNMGAIAPTAIVYPVQPIASATTNETLTAGQSGNIIVFTGTANNTQFILPTGTNGLSFTFNNNTTNYFAVIPASTADTIEIASTVAGTGVKDSSSTAIGNSITLTCYTPNSWAITAQSGTWATGN